MAFRHPSLQPFYKIKMPNEGIKNRQDLIDHLEEIRKDFSANGDEWENNNLENYLEALQAYFQDIEGYYKNRGEKIEDIEPWRMFADALSGAVVYE
jgi:hypothetical protein